MRLKDKVAIVTGGGSGIGKVSAMTFAREGAKVVVADINEAAARATAEEITGCDLHATALRLDVTNADSVRAMVQATVAQFGRIDILLNNAGITKDSRLIKMEEAAFDAVIDVNLKGTWLCGREVAAQMMTQNSGSIINVSSIVGLFGNFGQSNYAASKGGVIAMSKTWARELGKYNVRVNAVAPGFVATDMIATVPEKVIAAFQEQTPLGRLASPQEVANVYTFLASDDASYVTGTVISVDGGLTL